MLVVPVFVPEWEDVIVPHFLDELIVDSTFEFLLELLFSQISSLDENSSEVVYPFASFLCSSSLEVKCALGRSNRETQ